jgi:hypothetical protein
MGLGLWPMGKTLNLCEPCLFFGSVHSRLVAPCPILGIRVLSWYSDQRDGSFHFEMLV